LDTSRCADPDEETRRVQWRIGTALERINVSARG
jgi:hypothetical protein